MIINSCNLIRYKNSNFTPMLQIYTKGYGVKFTDQVFLFNLNRHKSEKRQFGVIDGERTSFGESLKSLVHEIAACLKQLVLSLTVNF